MEQPRYCSSIFRRSLYFLEFKQEAVSLALVSLFNCKTCFYKFHFRNFDFHKLACWALVHPFPNEAGNLHDQVLSLFDTVIWNVLLNFNRAAVLSSDCFGFCIEALLRTDVIIIRKEWLTGFPEIGHFESSLFLASSCWHIQEKLNILGIFEVKMRLPVQSSKKFVEGLCKSDFVDQNVNIWCFVEYWELVKNFLYKKGQETYIVNKLPEKKHAFVHREYHPRPPYCWNWIM